MKIIFKFLNDSILVNDKNISSLNNKSELINNDFFNVDVKNNKLIVKRKFHIKEMLYYFYTNNQIVFFTDFNEVDVNFYNVIDNNYFNEFLTYGYVFPPNNFLKNIYKMPILSYLILNFASDKLNVCLNYCLNYNNNCDYQNLHKNLKDCCENVENSALMFSGGLDSSILSLLFRDKISHNYSSGFEFNTLDFIEKKYALTAKDLLNISSLHTVFNFKELLLLLPNAVYITQMPLNHIQTLLVYALLLKIPKDEKFILNGEGADAIFGTNTQSNYFNSISNDLLINKNIINFNFLDNSFKSFSAKFDLDKNKYGISDLHFDYFINLMGNCDITVCSWDMLASKSGKTMIFPFFSQNNFYYALSKSDDIRFCKAKNILKVFANDIGVPDLIINRPKASFGPVSNDWSKYLQPLLPLCENVLNIKFSNSLIKSNNYRYNLWNLINFSVWKLLFIDKMEVDKINNIFKELLHND